MRVQTQNLDTASWSRAMHKNRHELLSPWFPPTICGLGFRVEALKGPLRVFQPLP